MKFSGSFQISAQNIDCGYLLEPPRRGGSNEYPQSMYLSRNNKINVYPCKPQFYRIKVGFKGSKLYRRDFVTVIMKHTLPEAPKERKAEEQIMTRNDGTVAITGIKKELR